MNGTQPPHNSVSLSCRKQLTNSSKKTYNLRDITWGGIKTTVEENRGGSRCNEILWNII